MADTPGWVIALAFITPFAIIGTIAVTFILISNHNSTTTFTRDANNNIIQIVQRDSI